jgi:hypothetical protein
MHSRKIIIGHTAFLVKQIAEVQSINFYLFVRQISTKQSTREKKLIGRFELFGQQKPHRTKYSEKSVIGHFYLFVKTRQ